MSAEFYRSEFRELITGLKKTFPEIKTLGKYAEIICGPFGTEITLNDYVDEGVPLLRISDITKDGTLDLSEVKFITHDKAAKLISTQVVENDLVISQRGTFGNARCRFR
ncbi:MAG: hypothetical protein NTX45_28115 [Proteobacteria bacterium]|nr:hypothetical protein [Pseudomonadota bacterium]